VRLDAEHTVDQSLALARPATEGGAWVRVLADEARQAATEIDPEAPLAGWTLGVKDLFAVAGIPIGAGSRLREDAEPEPEDAAVVGALRQAGALVMGSVALHELAFGATGINALGTPDNPRMPGHIPGGSSSGSGVAVADGSARLTLGTDTGGSTRVPAALCAVVGFKPAHGTYSVEGLMPLAPSMDHVGLMAATVDDVARAHAVLAGPDTAPAQGRTLGLIRRQVEDADPEVGVAVEQALRSLEASGYRLKDVELQDVAKVFDFTTVVLFGEAAMTYADSRDRWETHLGADVCDRLVKGAAIPEADYRQALDERDLHLGRVRDLLSEVDMLIGPTAPTLPPTVEGASADPTLAPRMIANTRLANYIGTPALSVPVAPGVPVGLQLMGMSNSSVLAQAAEIERALA
jgi:Asp-tRNA(Asn)/Glu-tRNA(Gln) amidotransferase A subunit family amidase